MTGKLRSIMWPAYLAALLLSLPAAPASGRDAGPRSALDRAHLGEDGPQSAEHMTKAALPEEDGEDEKDGEA
jgi:hypothetical protein